MSVLIEIHKEKVKNLMNPNNKKNISKTDTVDIIFDNQSYIDSNIKNYINKKKTDINNDTESVINYYLNFNDHLFTYSMVESMNEINLVNNEKERENEQTDKMKYDNDTEEVEDKILNYIEYDDINNREHDFFSNDNLDSIKKDKKKQKNRLKNLCNALKVIKENFEDKLYNRQLNNILESHLSNTIKNSIWNESLIDLINNNNDEIDHEICQYCKTEKIIYKNEALQICPVCSRGEYIFVDAMCKSTSDENLRDTTNYKHENHMNEIIAQFQAKEHINVPDDVCERIKNELKKKRLLHQNKLNPQIMKEILKKLGLTKKYGEHKTYIMYYILGIIPPILSKKQEGIIRSQFNEIIVPWTLLHEELNRKNLIRYHYIFGKLCELNGFDEFLPFIPKMSYIKTHSQDCIWKKFCEFLKWQYIPST